MALNKRTRTNSASSNTAATVSKETAAPVTDMDALKTALAQLVQLVTELNSKLAEQTARADEFEKRLDEFEEKLDAALEENADEDDDEDEDEDEEDDDEDADDDVKPEEIDCKKTYQHLTALDADKQKKVTVAAMKSLGVKSLQARTILKDANAALAVAEILCSDEFGFAVDDFLKPEA